MTDGQECGLGRARGPVGGGAESSVCFGFFALGGVEQITVRAYGFFITLLIFLLPPSTHTHTQTPSASVRGSDRRQHCLPRTSSLR